MEGPPPGLLADRLNAITPRSASPLVFNDSDAITPSPSAESTTVLADYNDPIILDVKDVSLRDTESKLQGGSADFEEALRQSIRGVLRLWKAGRRKYFFTVPADRQKENEYFLHIVREIVEEP